MKISDFDWDEANSNHVARHGVTPDEAEEIFVNAPRFLKSRRGRYVALGRSAQGRWLFVVFDYQGRGMARIITARDMTKSERRLYRR